MRIRPLPLVALIVVALVATHRSATAYPIAFDGSGAAGVDPFGHTWTVSVQILDGGDGAWGIPGLGLGTIVFQGVCCAMDFHAEFFDAEGAIFIDPDPLPSGTGGYDESTRFSNLSDGVLWDRVIFQNTVSFFAPAGTSLAPGELFFLNVVFDRPIVGDLEFNAEWTGTVPEPATLLLLGCGVAAAGIRRRLKRVA